MTKYRSVFILMAEDDEEDRMLADEALSESRLINEVFFVDNGEALMAYLKGESPYEDRNKYPLPGLILLDLNMPKKDGRECLKEIKEIDRLKRIPIVVLSTSKAEEDILKTYDLGVSSFITKPVTFESLVEVMNTLGKYWFEIVELPNI